ncbi:hypothetical protein DFP73DRAFT_563041 [Morchella snyderi]|nr:hypothetical protein DFP73DRAFT_563041 [Morchella snyderi]
MSCECLLTPSQWLRSSVVSVLFSLISETVLWNHLLIILIFVCLGTTALCLHIYGPTVSLVLHCLQLTRISIFFFIISWLLAKG